uniref:Uncharacterized protein n=1 Tax=Oryza meridionalis TaxID=40149 RepID=A0A0E0F0F6_9ORYZ
MVRYLDGCRGGRRAARTVGSCGAFAAGVGVGVYARPRVDLFVVAVGKEGGESYAEARAVVVRPARCVAFLCGWERSSPASRVAWWRRDATRRRGGNLIRVGSPFRALKKSPGPRPTRGYINV